MNEVIKKKENLLKEIYEVSDIMLNALKASDGEIFESQLPEREALILELSTLDGCTSPEIERVSAMLVIQVAELEKESTAFMERMKDDLTEIKKLQKAEQEAGKVRDSYNQITGDDMSVLFDKTQ